MATFYSPRIVTDGLVLHLDAGNRRSYVSGSTIWTDLVNNSRTGSLVNGPTFDSSNQGSIVFDGVNENVDYFPGYREIEEMFLWNGKIVNIVRCVFSQDYSTQTEYNREYDRCVDEEIERCYVE